MEKVKVSEATCDSCAGVYFAVSKRHYCTHCNKYYYVCPNCADAAPKCRFCGIPLKRRTEPQVYRSVRKQPQPRV